MRAGGAMRLPGILLAGLVVFLPWSEGGADPLGLFVAHTLVFALLAVAVLGRLREGSAAVSVGWEAIGATALVAACAVSSLGADYLFGTALASLDVIVAALLALALIVMREHPWKTMAWLVSASSAVQAIVALTAGGSATLTASASFVNASDLAAYLDIGTLVSAGLALEGWRGARGARAAGAWLLFGLPCAVVLLDLAALLSIGSRGALLALVVVSFAWIVSRAPRGPIRRAALSALAIVMLAGAIGVAARFERIADPYRFDRLLIWKAGLEAAAERPMLGLGPGMFQRRGYHYNFPLEREMFRYSKRLTSTHSTYLQAAAETGAVGVCALALFLLLLSRRLWRLGLGHPTAETGAVMAVAACLIHATVDTPLDVPANALTLVVLLVPLVITRQLRDADLHWSPASTWRMLKPATVIAAAGSLATVYAAGVLFPYLAHVSFERGDLDRAVALNPYNPLYRAERAGATWSVERMLEPEIMAAAHRDLEAAHHLDPGNPDHLRSLGRLHAHALFELGATAAETRRAEGYYRRVLALDVKDPRHHLELASFLLALGRGEESLTLIDEALALEPRFLAARQLRIRILLDEGRLEEAGEALRDLEILVAEMRSYLPKNGYEADLMRVDPSALDDLRKRLSVQ